MRTLTIQESCTPREKLDSNLESMYINRILDTLLTIPPEYWKTVMRIVTRWVEAGITSGKVKGKP